MLNRIRYEGKNTTNILWIVWLASRGPITLFVARVQANIVLM